ncbi:MAG TPA: hypothetical protein VI895_00105 [Bdellovibrionota bacterium]|nr:hypothetical protein [Bdellovibrionota bacterium]
MAEATTCRKEKCKRPVRAKRYCDLHYRAWRRGELPKARHKNCKSEGCRKPMIRQGYCEAHFDAWKASRKHVVRVLESKKKAEEAKQKPAEVPAPAPAPAAAAPAAPPEDETPPAA